MHTWITNIEASIWKDSADSAHPELTLQLSDILNNLLQSESTLLFRDKILEITNFYENDMFKYIVDLIARVPTQLYGEEKSALYLKSTPDVTININEEIIKKETLYQLFALHFNKETYSLHIISSDRLDNHLQGNRLILTRDKTNTHKIFLEKNSQSVFQSFLEKLRPKLNQMKHTQFQRNIGKGKIASTFKAWDKNNENYAHQLLQEAFNIYLGDEFPPHDLYTWDEKNKTYVHFMHSGNNEFHGYDIPITEVPDKIKKIFHIYK